MARRLVRAGAAAAGSRAKGLTRECTGVYFSKVGSRTQYPTDLAMNESKSSAAARDDLLAKVLALPAADRQFIAERIDETLEQETGFSQGPFATPELAQAWADEVERRIDMIDKGLVKPLPADVALREAREHLERRRAGRAAS